MCEIGGFSLLYIHIFLSILFSIAEDMGSLEQTVPVIDFGVDARIQAILYSKQKLDGTESGFNYGAAGCLHGGSHVVIFIKNGKYQLSG